MKSLQGKGYSHHNTSDNTSAPREINLPLGFHVWWSWAKYKYLKAEQLKAPLFCDNGAVL
jgi:hypothetical protein